MIFIYFVFVKVWLSYTKSPKTWDGWNFLIIFLGLLSIGSDVQMYIYKSILYVCLRWLAGWNVVVLRRWTILWFRLQIFKFFRVSHATIDPNSHQQMKVMELVATIPPTSVTGNNVLIINVSCGCLLLYQMILCLFQGCKMG